MPNGIPALYTFWRVFAGLNPQQFQHGFINWISAVSEVTQGRVIAIDGKTLRRSHDRALGRDVIYMVSAWVASNWMVLGWVKLKPFSVRV